MRRVLPFVLFAGLLLAVSWADPAHRVVGRLDGEFRDHVWVAWLVQTRVWTDHALPVFFPQANFPNGLRLYPLDPLNQLVLLGLAPLTGLLPALALLATSLLSLVGVGGERLARALGASPTAAMAGGFLAMLGPPVLGPFVDCQTEGWGTGWTLLLLATVADDGPWTRGRALRAGALAVALIATSPYQAHGLALVVVPAILWRGRRMALWAALPVVLVGGALAGSLWLVESGANGQLGARMRHQGDWPPRAFFLANPLPPESQAAPSMAQPRGAYPRADQNPGQTGPRRWSGWVLPVLAVAAAVRDRRARWLLAGAALYTSFSLGGARDAGEWTIVGGGRIPLPYDLFYRFYPFARVAWKPAQYAIPAWLFASAAATLLPRRFAVAGAALVALEAQLRGPTPAPLPAMELAPLPVHAVLAEAEGAVIEFPCRERSRNGVDHVPADVFVGQTFHGRPIGEPFGRARNIVHTNFLASLAASVGWQVRSPLLLKNAAQVTWAAGFRWLVVHGGALTETERAAVDRALDGLVSSRRAFDDGVVLYALAKPGAAP